MSVTQLKVKFGRLLSECLRNADIKQKDLASKLEISSSAVSQFMHGKIVPNQNHLNTIYEMVAIDRAKAYELDSMLAKIRSGLEAQRSPLNDLIFRLRCERNLSIRQLANLSGVPMARINAYENYYEAVISLDDAERLAPILGCSSKSLMFPTGYMELEAGENAQEYHAELPIPLLSLGDMDEYTPGISLLAYAGSRTRQTISAEPLGKVDFIAIAAPAKSLSIGIPGQVLLYLSENRLEGYRELNLARHADGLYSLIETRGEKIRTFKIAGARQNREIGPILWELPVLEMSVKMLKK